jgi:hypothetical protein
LHLRQISIAVGLFLFFFVFLERTVGLFLE